jgi:hypothetical protein
MTPELRIETLEEQARRELLVQVSAECDDLRREFTSQIEAIRAIRAVVLSMAARWDGYRSEHLELADALSRAMSTTQEETMHQPAKTRHPDRGATSTTSRSGFSFLADDDHTLQPGDLHATTLPARPGLILPPTARKGKE